MYIYEIDLEEVTLYFKEDTMGHRIGNLSQYYVDLIKRNYATAREAGLSRLSVEWGTWSREMNLQIRKHIEQEEHPEYVRLKYVFVLWVTVSQLLELYHRYPASFLKRGRKRKLEKEIRDLEKIILSDKEPADFSDDEEKEKSFIDIFGLLVKG